MSSVYVYTHLDDFLKFVVDQTLALDRNFLFIQDGIGYLITKMGKR
jgi:hypothetical protein